MAFAKVTLIGNLGRSPEIRYTPQGLAVTDFSLAVSEKKKDKDGNWTDNTTWFKVSVFGKQAENATKYLSTGSQVYVEGRFSQETWTDKDGNERTSLVVSATDVQFLSKTNKDDETDEQPTKSKAKAATVETDDSEIPF